MALERVYLVILGTPTEPEMVLGAFSSQEHASVAVNYYMADPDIPPSKTGFSVVTLPVDQGIAQALARKS